MDSELGACTEDRRAELEERRPSAANRTNMWAADCAIHELDRLEGWLNLARHRALAEHRADRSGVQAKTLAAREPER
jgi:hypothetical protein